MTASYTNRANMPLSLAVWLTNDNYDHDDRSNHISATSLLKPIRQLVLAMRVPQEDNVPDISAMIPSRMGSAIHDGIERSWVDKYKEGLAALGLPPKVIDRVLVNPTSEELTEDCIPVYLEQRSEKEVDGFIISGKFDFIGEGRVEDFKTTSVYTYINKSNDDKYIMQGSIYRWLNPDIITRDEMAIQFIFTDWQGHRAKVEPKYPDSRHQEYVLPLKSLAETEFYIRTKIAEIKQYINAPEEVIPECTDDDLWRKQTVWKYYKKPGASRSTKNYDNPHEANARAAMEGGVVVEVPGEIVACKYCDAFTVCTQKDRYLQTGELKL